MAYISSSIPESRVASGELCSSGCCSSESICCVLIALGTGFGARGESTEAVGFAERSPWSSRKPQNDFTAATLRATVAGA